MMKQSFIILILLIIIIVTTSMIVLNQSKFGQPPKGVRLERIKKSPNYRKGEFRNLHETSAAKPSL